MVYIPAMKAQHLAVSATAVVAAMVQVAVVVEAAVEQVAVVVAAVVQVAVVVEAWEMAAEGRRGRALLTPHLRHHPLMRRRVGQAWICKPGNLWCPHQQMHRWPMTTTLNGHSKFTLELFHAARVNALQECHLARGRHTFYVVGQGSR